MTAPYIESEVNAAIAATIAELQSQLTAFQTATQSLAGQLADTQLQLTAANARVAELEDKTNNLSLLVVRLARRVRVFEKGSDVATKALDYLVRSGLMPSVLRNEKQ